MEYNTRYYFDGKLHQLNPKMTAEHTFVLSDGTLVAMFQGNRGQRPELDFKIKIMRSGVEQRPETPPHTYWVVDLMMKALSYPQEVNEILDYYIDFYDNCVPFCTVQERLNYTPQTVSPMFQRYNHVRVDKTLPIDYIFYLIELFSRCEKQNDGAYMFKDILHLLKNYVDGTADYMDILRNSVPMARR